MRRRLQRTNLPVEKVPYEVQYENAAFLRRVFKRTARLTPAAYRSMFQVADAGAFSLDPITRR